MVTKNKRKTNETKIKTRCSYCGKLGGCSMIHEKCVIEYLKSQGYEIRKFISPIEILEGLE